MKYENLRFSEASEMTIYLSELASKGKGFKDQHNRIYLFREDVIDKHLAPYKDKPFQFKYLIEKEGDNFILKTDHNVIANENEYIVTIESGEPHILEIANRIQGGVTLIFQPKDDLTKPPTVLTSK